jgi:hypothetical protein
VFLACFSSYIRLRDREERAKLVAAHPSCIENRVEEMEPGQDRPVLADNLDLKVPHPAAVEIDRELTARRS